MGSRRLLAFFGAFLKRTGALAKDTEVMPEECPVLSELSDVKELTRPFQPCTIEPHILRWPEGACHNPLPFSRCPAAYAAVGHRLSLHLVGICLSRMWNSSRPVA